MTSVPPSGVEATIRRRIEAMTDVELEQFAIEQAALVDDLRRENEELRRPYDECPSCGAVIRERMAGRYEGQARSEG